MRPCDSQKVISAGCTPNPTGTIQTLNMQFAQLEIILSSVQIQNMWKYNDWVFIDKRSY